MSAITQNGYAAILRGIKAPVNGSTLRACHVWQRAEGGNARYNPWNTTKYEPGATAYNTFGDHHQYHVWNYPNEATGIKATIATLLQPNFEHIVQEFRTGTSGLAICEAVDGSAWGTHGAARLYEETYPPEQHPQEVNKSDAANAQLAESADSLTSAVVPTDSAS